ncbi:aspartate dehydrogenase [Bosea caraganae]|uniref:L-aspartate dehydrogenase n=1 Tax=Bosea caraganae TaxID=2763117 RepID=A0A370L2I2_9HYPH|nr:aspartate dehydrogenase [Bosea caraganae]RDJ22251.1 aspartate dehydrogenase [Bosea caraganae]RDJ22662.1 aspartate dehydrogenase [Bosea caraganae]
MSRRRIALIGFGSIAGDLAPALLARTAPGYELGVLLPPESESRVRVPEGCALLADCEELRAFGPEIVVEAAGHEAVRKSVPQCLALGLPVLISSIGALHDEALFAGLVKTAKASGGRILLPSGALGGVDYVRAVRDATSLALRYESHKPPAAWREELVKRGHDPATLAEPVTLFRGNAREAAATYPLNLNVAAALALAGPGFEKVEVAVICDPAARGNSHAITVDCEYGTMRTEITNAPSPSNPKTSWIVSRSLLAAIEQYFSPVMML